MVQSRDAYSIIVAVGTVLSGLYRIAQGTFTYMYCRHGIPGLVSRFVVEPTVSLQLSG